MFETYRIGILLRNHSKGIGFDRQSHQYFTASHTLTPATRLVRSVFPEFNAIKTSESLACKELGIDLQNATAADYLKIKEHSRTLRASWSTSRDFGTQTHELAEQCLLAGVDNYVELGKPYMHSNKIDGMVLSYFPGISNFIEDNKHLLREGLVSTEQTVWSSVFNTAGTIDFLTYSSDSKSLDIWDWKTDKSICPPELNFGKFGFGMFSHLPDTNYYHYTLQLGVYRRLLEDLGLPVSGMHLVHLRPSTFDGISDQRPTDKFYDVIDLPYLSDEVSHLLNSNIV